MNEIDLSRAVWQKSSRSNGQGGECVEVAANLPKIVAVRDSKQPDGPTLIFKSTAWRTFLAMVQDGAFDLG